MRAVMTSIALAALFAAPVGAQPAAESYTVAVSYGDLNIHSAAGVATFQGRVKASANRVCGLDPVAPLKEGIEARKCRAAFIRGAQRNLELARKPVRETLLASR